MKPFYIAPSILSANFAKLGEEVENILQAGADLIHFDVMDNHYVPNLTVGPVVCQALRDFGITAPIDVHLMVEPVDDLIVQFAKAGASYISIHPEATRHLDRSLQLIREHNVKAAIALNPATPVSYLDHILDQIDMVLVMSVNPGFAGQQFIPEALEKIKLVKEKIKNTNKPIRIEIDGGVKIDNIAEIAKAGADTFVAGSAIFHSSDYKKTIAAMREKLHAIVSAHPF